MTGAAGRAGGEPRRRLAPLPFPAPAAGRVGFGGPIPRLQVRLGLGLPFRAFFQAFGMPSVCTTELGDPSASSRLKKGRMASMKTSRSASSNMWVLLGGVMPRVVPLNRRWEHAVFSQ